MSGRAHGSYAEDLGIPQIKGALSELTRMLRRCSLPASDLKKPMDQWVSELKYVQYTKNNVEHSALGRTPFEVHLGGPTDISVALKLPQELIDSLNTDDDVENALHTDRWRDHRILYPNYREYSSSCPTIEHAYPTPTLSHDM